MNNLKLEIEEFKCQLYSETMGYLDDENPATYSLILKQFNEVLADNQREYLENMILKCKAKINYVNRINTNYDLQPYVECEPNNYVIKH